MRITSALLAAFGALAAIAIAPDARAQSALTGQVTSAEEGTMEGVVVSAKRAGSTITVSVVSDAQGRFAFPADRLEPGAYTLRIRAAGYQLDGAAKATVAAGQPATSDLRLKKLRSLSASLTNAEWLHSMPGTDQQKKFLLNCTGCHTLERIMKSSYDADGFVDVIARMSTYYPGSSPQRPQRLPGDFRRDRDRGGNVRQIAQWLSTVNLSQQDTWQFQLKTLPRLKGKSTRVIFTEFDLPDPAIQPHDVILDSKGNVWYSDFAQMFLGKMNPRTGEVTQYPIPVNKPDYPTGSLDLEVDSHDNIWLGVMYQASIVRFDQKTETFRSWSIPHEWDSAGAQFGHLAVTGTDVDGMVWIKNSDGTYIYRLNLATNTWESLGQPKDPRTGRRIGTYGIHSDQQNNAYLLDFSAGNIVRIDAKTKEQTVYLTPTQGSTPRRGRVDAEGRLWFAEYRADRVGMLDPRTAEMHEWRIPTAWSAPYDAVFSRHGHAWTGSMLTDRVARLDVETGEYTEYTLPRPTNIRRVFVDDRSNPGTLWIGSNHGASIVKVEVQDQ